MRKNVKEFKKLTIGVDIDDTSTDFTENICKRCEQKFNKKFPVEDVVWGFTNYTSEEVEYVHALFKDPEFIRSLEPYRGMFEFLQELVNRGHDVVFITSTYSNVMTERALWLLEKFGFIHPRNYIMTGRKDLVTLDILFDDCLSHIENSIAKVPVLITKPWNLDAKGHVRANRVEDYMPIVEMVEAGYDKHDIYLKQNPVFNCNSPKILVMVGASASGKTRITTELITRYPELFERVVTNTTRDPREGEVNGVDYNFSSDRLFKKLISSNSLLEWSEYAGKKYGTSKQAVEKILNEGKNAILVMDINGAKSVAATYPDNTVTVYIERDKSILIHELLQRPVSEEEKIKRIIQLDKDFKSAGACNYKVRNVEIDDTLKTIMNILGV